MANTPGLTEPSPDQGALQDEIPADKAAAMAMESTHQAFAGSAQGVGSIGFDEPGVFEIGDEAEQKDRQASAPGSQRDDPVKPEPEVLRGSAD